MSQFPFPHVYLLIFPYTHIHCHSTLYNRCKTTTKLLPLKYPCNMNLGLESQPLGFERDQFSFILFLGYDHKQIGHVYNFLWEFPKIPINHWFWF